MKITNYNWSIREIKYPGIQELAKHDGPVPTSVVLGSLPYRLCPRQVGFQDQFRGPGTFVESRDSNLAAVDLLADTIWHIA